MHKEKKEEKKEEKSNGHNIDKVAAVILIGTLVIAFGYGVGATIKKSQDQKNKPLPTGVQLFTLDGKTYLVNDRGGIVEHKPSSSHISEESID